MAAINAIESAGPEENPAGIVPASWLSGRRMGIVRGLKKRCADISASEWVSHLRRNIESTSIENALAPGVQLDLSHLMSKNRRLSQSASRLIHDTGEFGGIRYQSRHGSELINWALFDPFALNDTSCLELDAEDPHFHEALNRLDLKLEWRPGVYKVP